jgi:hypothetical protein
MVTIFLMFRLTTIDNLLTIAIWGQTHATINFTNTLVLFKYTQQQNQDCEFYYQLCRFTLYKQIIMKIHLMWTNQHSQQDMIWWNWCYNLTICYLVHDKD